MSDLPELRTDGAHSPSRRDKKSAVSILDDALLVVGAVVVALVVLKALSIIAGTFFFLLKLAAVAGVVYVALRLLRNRGR